MAGASDDDPTSARCSALLIDYGGVLTTPVTHSFRAFCEGAGLPARAVKEAFLVAYRDGDVDSPVHRLETGRMSGEDFGHALAAALTERSGVPLEGAGLLERLFARVAVDERMLGAVESIRRAGVRTVLLSNSWGDSGYPRERFAALFDAVVISGEVGMRKPDPDIFHHAAAAIDAPPQRCVFVDDLDLNVQAAEALGMTGIVHRDAATTLARLADLLGLDPVQRDTSGR